jgi:hypothetical protein
MHGSDGSAGSDSSRQPPRQPLLALEVSLRGALLPSDGLDWQQLAPLAALATLLLPSHQPPLLPCMLPGSGAGGRGLASLAQLRALQLSVEAGACRVGVRRVVSLDSVGCCRRTHTPPCAHTQHARAPTHHNRARARACTHHDTPLQQATARRTWRSSGACCHPTRRLQPSRPLPAARRWPTAAWGHSRG